MIDHVAVVVPAADEQERISTCLAALAASVDHLSQVTAGSVTAEVVVVLDACRDRTAEEVARYPGVQAVVSDARCVGAARGLGTGFALRRRTELERVWTAHTDADSTVPRHWLERLVRAAEDGADLVLGTVVPSLRLARPVRSAWDRLHRVDDGHPHVHGANLGIRASTLAAVGGWAPLPTGEDVDLAERAEISGARVVRLGNIAVSTSSRAIGRAPHGFSSYLRDLADQTG